MKLRSFLISSMRTVALLALTAAAVSEAKAEAPATMSEQAIISRARQFYKNKNYNSAINEYSKIQIGSDRWALAKEELGWTYFRMQEHSKALAQVRSLTNDYMSTQIDLEPFLLQSIVLLYNCDYKAVYQTLKDVRSRMAPYVGAMEKLTKSQWNEEQQNSLQTLIQDKTHRNLKPEQFNLLPRQFYLDKSAAAAIKTGNASGLRARIQQLADMADKRNHKLLQNLHLVEVEAIQRAFVPNNFKGKQRMAIPNDQDILIFNNDKELWADEIDKVQADVDLCASKTGRTL